jgi:hypothetical protein
MVGGGTDACDAAGIALVMPQLLVVGCVGGGPFRCPQWRTRIVIVISSWSVQTIL